MDIRVNICNYIDVPADADFGIRTLRDYELIFFVYGEAEYFYGEKLRERIVAYPHAILCIPPGEAHSLRCLSKVKFSCIHLTFLDDSQCEIRPEMAHIYDSGDDFEIFHQLFYQSAREFSGALPDRGELLNLQVREICLRLRRIGNPQSSSRTLLAEKIEKFVRVHLLDQPGRNELATLLKVTPEHVNYIFRREFGCTPGEYITRRRIYYAYQLLLDENLSVKEAAERSGFADPYYFSKVFKKVTGYSPGTVNRVLPAGIKAK